MRAQPGAVPQAVRGVPPDDRPVPPDDRPVPPDDPPGPTGDPPALPGDSPERPLVRVRAADAADRADWDRFVADAPAGDPLQSWAWGEVAAGWGEQPRRFIATTPDGVTYGLAQILVRAAPFGRSVLYVPHGPLWLRERPEGPAALDALLAAIGEEGRRSRGIVAKLDPRAAFDGEAERLVGALGARGCRPARHDLQARSTRVVDLSVGEERLFADLEKDTRNAIRRSGREGVDVRVVRANDPQTCRELAALLAETGMRAGIHVRDEAALLRMGTEFAPSGSFYVALAELAGRPIAGCLALATGRRAFYLYAGSLRDASLRHAYGSYAALWGLCRALVADGRDSLDLWGVVEAGDPAADPSWQGFSLFKRGFGGAPLRHPGTFDMPLDAFWYRARSWRERAAARLR